jgi:hypothetical protein
VKEKAKIYEQVSKILEDVPLGVRGCRGMYALRPDLFHETLTRGAQSLALRAKKH